VLHGENRVQRINRFYASTNGYSLFKRKYNEDAGKTYKWERSNAYEAGEYTVPEYNEQNMLTKSGVTILNELYDTTVEGKHINYRYYISEAKKIVADFTEQQLELFSI
jgi:hypothetical protein